MSRAKTEKDFAIDRFTVSRPNMSEILINYVTFLYAIQISQLY